MIHHAGRGTRALGALVLVLVLGSGCGVSSERDAVPAGSPSARPQQGQGDVQGQVQQEKDGKQGTTAPTPPVPIESIEAIAAREQRKPLVLVVSVDGLTSSAISTLGPERLPHLWEVLGDGAGTLNARTAVELTVTMPNHVGMMTGRRVDAAQGGHGWTVNFDNGDEVGTPDRPVGSVFDVVEQAGRESALLTSKSKFTVFDRTWPSISDFVYVEDNSLLTDRALGLLESERPALTFLHLSAPDEAGHAAGWGTAKYKASVEMVDKLIGRLRERIESDRALRERLLLVLTADHGGQGREHGSADDPRNFTVPFMVAGPGVPEGVDLYSLNPQRLNPLNRQTSYDGKQPIRNADVANLALSLLGLGTLPGSQIGVRDPLVVTRP